MKYTTKPFEIEAIQCTGDNWPELIEFGEGAINGPLEDDYKGDDPDMVGEVFDMLHSVWIPFYVNNYIIKGMKGEFYPCVAEVFETKYEGILWR